MRLIDADAFAEKLQKDFKKVYTNAGKKVKPEDYYIERKSVYDADFLMAEIEMFCTMVDCFPTIDAVELVRCHDCVHAVPLERNCELNTCLYMHCNLWRGDETKNVWHKYKRFYKDYSLVEHDDFCSYGERKDNNDP